MTSAEWLTIGALVAGPILAIQVSEHLQRGRKKQNRRIELFRNLMATRRARLSPMHVHALNLIDSEFHGERKVQEAWKAYLDHLGMKGLSPELWESRAEDRLTDLLLEMSNTLKFGFDATHIRRAAYLPQAFGDTDDEFLAIRKALVAILKDGKGLPIQIVTPSDPASAEEKGKLAEQLRSLLAGETAIRVKIATEDPGPDRGHDDAHVRERAANEVDGMEPLRTSDRLTSSQPTCALLAKRCQTYNPQSTTLDSPRLEPVT